MRSLGNGCLSLCSCRCLAQLKCSELPGKAEILTPVEQNKASDMERYPKMTFSIRRSGCGDQLIQPHIFAEAVTLGGFYGSRAQGRRTMIHTTQGVTSTMG